MLCPCDFLLLLLSLPWVPCVSIPQSPLIVSRITPKQTAMLSSYRHNPVAAVAVAVAVAAGLALFLAAIQSQYLGVVRSTAAG